MASNNEKPAESSGGSSDVDRVSRQDHPKAMGFARHSKERRIPLPAEEASALAAAHALAALGLAVFPTGADCRQPLTKHGHKDATKAPEGINAFWRRHPRANVSVACGAASDCVVLDLDVKGADGRETLAALEAVHGLLPLTWRTRTPSGGLHFWFRLPARELRNRVGFMPGLDFKTDGGSVAVPPSRRADGVYQWEASPWSCDLAEAPDWLLDKTAPPQVRRIASAWTDSGLSRCAPRYVVTVVNRECADLAAMAPNSGRNMRLFKAAARIGEFVSASRISAEMAQRELEAAADSCGLIRDDGRRAVLATIKSGLQRGMANPRRLTS